MADLFDQLFVRSDDYKHVSIHYFTATLLDYMAGETTREEMVQIWELEPDAKYAARAPGQPRA